MDQVRLAFGKDGYLLNLQADWDVTIVEPQYVPGLADPAGELRRTLENPIDLEALDRLVQPGSSVGIIFNDITRATPNALILAAVLEQIESIPGVRITLFNALGTHRANTPAELERILGPDLAGRMRIVQNNCLDASTQVCLGTSAQGHEIWLNRELFECDLKILTGFIEPHFFAGFSGGGKAVMPGMAGLATILGNHCAANIADPRATWGVIAGNPIAAEIFEVAQKAGTTFLLNVAMNRDKEITAVFAGDLSAAHQAGCAFVKERAMVPVTEPFDIVVTSNSGYPLDLNLYQAVKGMSAAAQVVRPGGAILAVAECWDGLPEHGLFAQLLRETDSPENLLARVHAPGFACQDQWQVQVLAQILLKAEVSVYSRYLSKEQLSEAMLAWVESPESGLAELVQRFGPSARICILPEGPVTIPYVS